MAVVIIFTNIMTKFDNLSLKSKHPFLSYLGKFNSLKHQKEKRERTKLMYDTVKKYIIRC